MPIRIVGVIAGGALFRCHSAFRPRSQTNDINVWRLAAAKSVHGHLLDSAGKMASDNEFCEVLIAFVSVIPEDAMVISR